MFNRERQGITITQAGRDYLAVVRDALDRLALGTEHLLKQQHSGRLTISTSPDFAAKWLVHRLASFTDAHPEIDLRISASMHHVDFAREDVDLAVRHGDGRWADLAVVELAREHLFAVCSPRLLTGSDPIVTPEDLLRFPLLHLDNRKDWARWFEVAGLPDTDVSHGPILNHASMVIDAAVDGQGVALARTTLAAWDLVNGRLVRPFHFTLPISKTYWIVCPKPMASLPKIQTTREWLLSQSEADNRQLSTVPIGPFSASVAPAMQRSIA